MFLQATKYNIAQQETDYRVSMGKSTWTQAQVNYLVSAYQADTPNSEIAAALGKTRKAVENKAARLGITDKDRRDRNNSARMKAAHKEDTEFRRAFSEAVTRRRQNALPKELQPLRRKLARFGIPSNERAKILQDELRRQNSVYS